MEATPILLQRYRLLANTTEKDREPKMDSDLLFIDLCSSDESVPRHQVSAHVISARTVILDA
jgi:hypothetical protein